jgi:parallel beta-helix repeat protein
MNMVLKQRSAVRLLVVAVAGIAWWMLPATAQARTINVAPTGSTTAIQNAINEAAPGDTISVASGTYSGPTISVKTSGLTITGSAAAIINAKGNTYGITVGKKLEFEGTPAGPACPAREVSNFKISGLTVENAEIGIFLFSVDKFQVEGGIYQNNTEYGIFPRCSRDGLISGNSGGGGNDATIYVGEDERTTVENNGLTNGEFGVELENTDNSVVRNNLLTTNTSGIFVIVLPALPKTSTETALIEGNVVQKNNRPNPFPPACEPPPPFPANLPGCKPFFDDKQLLPTGTGILNVGGHKITINNNNVTSNNTVGIGVVENPFGFGSSNETRITNNLIQQNGKSPDPRAGVGADIVYLDQPKNGSCLSGNVFKTSFFREGEPPACT